MQKLAQEHKQGQNTIDMAGKLPFFVVIEGSELRVEYDFTALKNNKLKQFLYDNLMVISDDIVDIKGDFANIYEKNYQIRLKQHSLIAFHIEKSHNIIITSKPYMRLGVMELRMLAQQQNCAAPYNRINSPNPQDDNSKDWSIKTDLHTHLTSQIKAGDLLTIASEYKAAYPIELLELIGVNTQNYAKTSIASTPFSPAAQDMLQCEQPNKMVEAIEIAGLNPQDLGALQQAMEIGIDEVISFDQLERRIYRFRNPLAKNPNLIAATIVKIACDYQASGVAYAELAVTAALNPDWLAAALPALKAAHKMGMTLKLLIGLPRSLPPSQILAQLKMVMFVSQHPDIVGVDFLGYEANKTRNFSWALSHFARFAAAQKDTKNIIADDFIIRVHAGENGKNPDNVLEVLQIAEIFGVRVRVGHATYGDADACIAIAQKLAQNGLLIMEFNPDSNLAMNNIDCATDLPIVKWAQAGIPFVLASDGGGIYQTDAAQLLNAGIFSGLGAKEISLMMQTEATHIEYQLQLGKRKRAAFNAHYCGEKGYGNEEGYAEKDNVNDDAEQNFIAQMRLFQAKISNNQHNFDFAGKTPLLIAGASGSSWSRIDEKTKAEIKSGIAELVQRLDANKVAFVVGRIKPEGIGKILEDALAKHYANNPNSPIFDVVGLLSGQQNMPLIASYINHILPLHGELMSVPTQITNLLKLHQGVAIYIGGSAFTRDFILCSQNLGLSFAVMAGVAGASGEKARILPSENIFNGATEMVNWVCNKLG